MSKGPGTVERAIRELIAVKRQRSGDQITLDTESLCKAAFETEWPTKSQRVSALRAMHRIVATETGWTPARSDRLWFIWRRPGSRPRRASGKPQKVHEPILAPRAGPWLLRWDQAVITSRGGASPDRVTVEYQGRRYQCHELSDGRIMWRQSRSGGTDFCHERARAIVEKEQEDYWHSLARSRPDWAARHAQAQAAWAARHVPAP